MSRTTGGISISDGIIRGGTDTIHGMARPGVGIIRPGVGITHLGVGMLMTGTGIIHGMIHGGGLYTDQVSILLIIGLDMAPDIMLRHLEDRAGMYTTANATARHPLTGISTGVVYPRV